MAGRHKEFLGGTDDALAEAVPEISPNTMR